MMIKYPTYVPELQTIKDQMILPNDAWLMGVDLDDPRTWLATGSLLPMGYVPRGDNTPQSWQNGIVNKSFNTLIPWQGMTPWFSASYGVDSLSTNTRINVSNFSMQLYDKSISAWRKVHLTSNSMPSWCIGQSYANKGLVNLPDSVKRIENDGSWSIQMPLSEMVHGGSTIYAIGDIITPYTNIGGVFVKMEAKLVLDNLAGVDDRALAQILFSVGADFYPHTTTTYNDLADVFYFPASAISRWTMTDIGLSLYYMATINPPPLTEQDKSPYAAAGNITLMPSATFDTYLPPYIRG